MVPQFTPVAPVSMAVVRVKYEIHVVVMCSCRTMIGGAGMYMTT